MTTTTAAVATEAQVALTEAASRLPWTTPDGPKRLAEAAQRLGVLLLVLFGSTAKGTGRPGSDLDLAVLFQGPPKDESWLDEETAFATALEPLLEPSRAVDLVVLNLASSTLLMEVRREGRVLYQDNPWRWMEFRVHARHRWEDDSRFRRRRWEWLLRRFGPGSDASSAGG